MVSGLNPTDWKTRRHPGRPVITTPGQDGAGIVMRTGPGVERLRRGDRVWLWDVAYTTGRGTSAEAVTVPQDHAVRLPEGVSFDEGASAGIPALTAALCLMKGDPARPLTSRSLRGEDVLVTGGAGAVGHAAIQLAAWAGARVLTTVSSTQKADLARAAGAAHVIDYTQESVVDEVLALAPGGMATIVDVALGENIDADLQVIAPMGTVSAYAVASDGDVAVPLRRALRSNVRIRTVFTYTVPDEAKMAALESVQAALRARALSVGVENGLPLHRFSLDNAGEAHAAGRSGAVGKVIIDMVDSADEA